MKATASTTGNHLKNFFAEIETVPLALQSSYYPSLDGIRAVAIIMVLVSHLKLSSGFYYDALFNGSLGVMIFFVLSGFLITALCLKEKATTKTISLKNFYIRRCLRILPVAFLYLIVIVILNKVFKLNVHYISILGAAFFLMDISSYFRKYYFLWYTGHYWSLAVEEQFYLVFPLLLKKQFKLYLLLILFIIFVLPIIICLQSLLPAINVGPLYAFTHLLVKFQAIAVGCLFAVLFFKYQLNATILFKGKTLTNLLAFVLILFIRYNDFFTLHNMFAGLAVSFLTGYLIITNIIPAGDVIFIFLNSKILKAIGVLSYSIYIWQQLFTSGDKNLPQFITRYPYNIFWIILVSLLSYYLYERFFLKLKAKFSRIKTAPIILTP